MNDDAEIRWERLGDWSGPRTPDHEREYSRFPVEWRNALSDLRREIRLLDAREAVLAVDCRAKDIGRSGNLLADARIDSPAVRLTIASRPHGTLVYACDRYKGAGSFSRYLPGWQANVRAITLTLEALRAVDRHGAARHGQQYSGFRAISDGRAAIPMTSGGWTRDTAAEWLATQAPVVSLTVTAEELLADPEARRTLRRALFHIAHPDKGGDADQFKRLSAAFDALA